MSSRGQFVGSAPDSGVYVPRPVPQEPDNLPTYVSDELLDLGGRLNGVLEGGAFPPQSELPKRFREGMMIYFTQPISNSDITSAGVWLYRRDKWWKLVDDPSAIEGVKSVAYQLTLDGIPPSTPPSGPNNPPTGWESVPPVKSNKSEWIWVTVEIDFVEGNYAWSAPTAWSAGVSDGSIGLPGDSAETRYLAWSSTTPPTIADPNEREPETPTGEVFTIALPNADPDGGKDAIYATSTSINTATDQVVTPWSDPVRYATPDNQVTVRSWAVGVDWDSVPPAHTPSNPGLPGPQWSYTQPADTQDYPIWLSERLEWTTGGATTEWTAPVRYNSRDGVDGAPGGGIQYLGSITVDLLNAIPVGNHIMGDQYKMLDSGVLTSGSINVYIDDMVIWTASNQWDNIGPGPTGPEGTRGNISITVEWDGDASPYPTDGQFDQKAWDSIVGQIQGMNPEVPIPWDVVTFIHPSPSDTNYSVRHRRFLSGNEPGVWSDVAQVVDGDQIVTGTIKGDSIRSDTKITVGGAAGQDVVILDADSSTARLWAGSLDANSAQFVVTPAGEMKCQNVTIGTPGGAGNGYFYGNITSNATITGGTLNSAQMRSANGNFIVDSAGNMTCINATVGGAITATTLTLGSAASDTIASDPRVNNDNTVYTQIGGTKPPADADKTNYTDSRVNNDNTVYTQIGGTKPPADADKTNYTDSRVNNNNITKAQLTSGGKIYPNQDNLQLKSNTYVAGSTGWAIDAGGTAEFNNVTVRGHIQANTASFSDVAFASMEVAKMNWGDAVQISADGVDAVGIPISASILVDADKTGGTNTIKAGLGVVKNVSSLNYKGIHLTGSGGTNSSSQLLSIEGTVNTFNAANSMVTIKNRGAGLALDVTGGIYFDGKEAQSGRKHKAKIRGGDGVVLVQSGGMSCLRIGTGRYRVTFPVITQTNANYQNYVVTGTASYSSMAIVGYYGSGISTSTQVDIEVRDTGGALRDVTYFDLVIEEI